MFDFSSSPLLARRTPGERRFRLFADVLIVWAIVYAAQLFAGLVPGMLATVILGLNGFSRIISEGIGAASTEGAAALNREAAIELAEKISGSEAYRIAEHFGQAWAIAAALFVCLSIQRRSLATMGIEKRGAAKRCVFGFLLGAALCGATVLVSVVFRAATFEGLSPDVDYLVVVFSFFGYLIQGAAEELLIHGLFMTDLARRFRWLPSVLFSSLMFALLHVFNNGVTLLSLLNVFLFGVFLGLFVIRTGSVLGAAALHAAWNYTEGRVFGCAVSGFASPTSLFTVTADAGRTATNGGTFGPEGGLAATMVLMLCLIAVLFIPSFKKKDRPTT